MAILNAEQYKLKPGETAQQYNARISPSYTQQTQNDNATSTPGEKVFTQELTKRLMNNLDIVSSEPSPIVETINKSIEDIHGARSSSEAGIRAKYERQRIDTLEQGDVTARTALDARSGFGTINAVLKNIKTDTERTLKDLDLREQEALASGRSEDARAIANLRLQALDFEQKAKQQAFSNLLSVAGFGIQARGQELSEQRFALEQRQQSQEERRYISQIALEYGLPITEGETIDTIVAKAAPFASEKQKLEIQKIKADINRSNAEVQKALRGEGANLDNVSASVLASAFLRGDTGFLSGIKDPNQFALVYSKIVEQKSPKEYSDEELRNKASEYKRAGYSFRDAIAELGLQQYDSNSSYAQPVKNLDRAALIFQEQFGVSSGQSKQAFSFGSDYIKNLTSNMNSEQQSAFQSVLQNVNNARF